MSPISPSMNCKSLSNYLGRCESHIAMVSYWNREKKDRTKKPARNENFYEKILLWIIRWLNFNPKSIKTLYLRIANWEWMLIIWPYFSLIVCWVFCRFRTVFWNCLEIYLVQYLIPSSIEFSIRMMMVFDEVPPTWYRRPPAERRFSQKPLITILQ